MSLLELVREQESQVEGGTMVALRRPSEEDATERLKGDLVERLGLGVVAQFAAGSDISRARR